MPEAGWYEDPEDVTLLRYWDGGRWTDERQRREPAPPEPPPAAASTPTPPPADTASPSPWDTAVAATEASGGWGGAGGAPFAGAAPPRTFGQAIKVCLTKYVDGKGRASRSEYWYFALFTLLVDVITGGVAAILLLLPSITVSVRRLHDIGKSAWALLWMLLPVIGWIVLIAYAVRPGEPDPNRFG